MSRFLRQNTAVTILIGQLFNWADSKTLLYEALGGNNYTPATLVCKLSKGSTQSTITLTLSGGNNDMTLLSDGLASLELTAGNTDTCGDLIITLTNATVGSEVVFPCKFEFTVIPAEVYDSLILGTDNLTTDLTSAYNAAKTSAQEGDKMDIIDAPNATAITAIQSGLATITNQAAILAEIDNLEAIMPTGKPDSPRIEG